MEYDDITLDMTDASIIAMMKECISSDDIEHAHGIADCLLTNKLRQLGYDELCDLYEQVPKWYA